MHKYHSQNKKLYLAFIINIMFKFIDEDTRVLVLIPHGEEYEEICNAVL